jgi:hypothetical protein
MVSSLSYPNLLGTKRLGCCCCVPLAPYFEVFVIITLPRGAIGELPARTVYSKK